MNVAVQFRRLLPASPLLRGTVVSSASGSTVVQFADGAQLTVRGTGTVGADVFVRGGAVEGVAPPASAIQAIEV